jgi:hypothetical protein
MTPTTGSKMRWYKGRFAVTPNNRSALSLRTRESLPNKKSALYEMTKHVIYSGSTKEYDGKWTWWPKAILSLNIRALPRK